MGEDKALLRVVDHSIRATGHDSIRHAVEATSLEPIVRKLPVAAWGLDKAAVIEVSDLFLSDPSEFSAKTRLNAQGADKARSFVDTIKSFPDNLETKVLMTYNLGGGPATNRIFGPVPARRDSGQAF